MNIETLKTRIAEAPREPGVYIWRDAKRHPLYIGKANNIRVRLSSYTKATDERMKAMVRVARSIDFRQTETEIDALILESQLIKRHKPKYNVALRDDKSYYLVAITDEEFPQFIPTHQVRSRMIKKPIKEYLGPFTEALALKTTLKVLRRLFPYCSCKQKHHIKCLNAHIGVCRSYCCLKTPASADEKKEYRQFVRAVRDILSGRRTSLITRLNKEMKTLATSGELERARDLQITIERIQRVFENAQIISRRQRSATRHHGALEQIQDEFGLPKLPNRIEGYDIAHIQGVHPTGAMIVFAEGSPDNTEYRLFNIKRPDGGDTAALREVLTRRLKHDEWPLPDAIVVDGAKAQLNVVMHTLDKARVDVPVIALAKDDKHKGSYVLSSSDARVRTLKKLPTKVRHLIEHVDREAHRFVIAHYRKRHRKHVLAP